MNNNIEFEFGFYTPGTRREREVLYKEWIKNQQRHQKRSKSRNSRRMRDNERNPQPELPPEPVSHQDVPPEISNRTTVRVETGENRHRPKITLARKDGIVVRGPSVLIPCPLDATERISLRNRELAIRERLNTSKSGQERYWYAGLQNYLDAQLDNVSPRL